MTPLPYSYVATKVDFLIGYQLHRSGLNPVNQPASMSITQQSTSHIITSPRYFDSNHTLLRLEPQPTSTRTTRYFDSNHSLLRLKPQPPTHAALPAEDRSRGRRAPFTHRYQPASPRPSNPSPDRALPDYCRRLTCHLSRRESER